MTNQEKQQLSCDVAAKYGIDAYRYIVTSFNEDLQPNLTETWLHDDSARCFGLMVEHDLWNINIVNCHVKVPTGEYSWILQEIIENNTEEATRIAILKALLAKGEL